MTASAVGARPAGTPGPDGGPAAPERPLLIVGAIAAGVVTAAGLAVITLLVLAGWIAAPHAGIGLKAVLRTSAALWLVGHHVGFTFRSAGRIGLLPVGLVLLPGALLWRAGAWVVRVGQVRRLRHVGYAALALAVPYAVLTGALALASRSALESSSLPQSLACGLLLALAAGGLGGARALAPWPQLIRLLPQRPRSVVVGVAGALATLATAGAVLAGASLAVHLREAATLERDLAPGAIGVALLLLLQLGYLPNAVIWAIAFALGPGFAFGSATVVAPTGSALTALPAFPMLAALPPGLHAAIPAWIEPTVLALPYLAGGLGGLLGLLAAVSGGPLGDGRLAAVGPSPWQVGVVSALEIGVAAAVTAGTLNYVALRRTGALSGRSGPSQSEPPARAEQAAAGHVIYVDPWAGDPVSGARASRPGPSALP